MAGTHFGGYAVAGRGGEQDVVALPERLSFEQGAAIPVNYATAWAGARALRRPAGGRARADPGGGRRRRDRGDCQLARRYGAEVYGAASPGKHDTVRAQGAVPSPTTSAGCRSST